MDRQLEDGTIGISITYILGHTAEQMTSTTSFLFRIRRAGATITICSINGGNMNSDIRLAIERVRETRWIRSQKSFLACRVSLPSEFPDPSTHLDNNCRLSPELVTRWQLAGRIDLYVQEPFGQWGVVLWDPWQLEYFHPGLFLRYQSDDAEVGDLAIGKCEGDTELVIARCDPSKPDFGHIVIQLEVDKRKDWPIVAPSLASFIHQYLDSPGRKFWPG